MSNGSNSGSILVINAGSSSLKFGMYAEQNGEEELLYDGLAAGIGRGSGKLELKDTGGRVLRSVSCQLSSQGDVAPGDYAGGGRRAPGLPPLRAAAYAPGAGAY